MEKLTIGDIAAGYPADLAVITNPMSISHDEVSWISAQIRGILMEKSVNKAEFVAVSSLSPEKRYSYCIKWIVDFERVWSLRTTDGWALSTDYDGDEVVPIWPYLEFAQACATGEWEGYYPSSIDLSVWLERWVPGMEHDNRKIGVFPTSTGQHLVVTPRRIEADMRQEMEWYE